MPEGIICLITKNPTGFHQGCREFGSGDSLKVHIPGENLWMTVETVVSDTEVIGLLDNHPGHEDYEYQDRVRARQTLNTATHVEWTVVDKVPVQQ